MGVAYLQFYQITEEPVYLKAALAARMRWRQMSGKGTTVSRPGRTGSMPDGSDHGRILFPRVAPVKLFDELARITEPDKTV
jgi:hypothetical protein